MQMKFDIPYITYFTRDAGPQRDEEYLVRVWEVDRDEEDRVGHTADLAKIDLEDDLIYDGDVVLRVEESGATQPQWSDLVIHSSQREAYLRTAERIARKNGLEIWNPTCVGYGRGIAI